jgi:Phosphotransferase enzyme family
MMPRWTVPDGLSGLARGQGYRATGIPVSDPFGAAGDPEMPSLALALNPVEVQRQFGSHLPHLSGEHGVAHLRAIRVTRYKPGRRCLIEYDMAVARAEGALEATTVIGKVRARRSGKSGYRLLDALWHNGFSADSQDGISVPEPIGTVSACRLWLQRKVPGRMATDLLMTPDGAALTPRLAEAAYKLHRAGVPTKRRHTMADELRILREHLSRLAQAKPQWAERLERLLDASQRLGAATPEPTPCGIHRDFYPDQVLVDGPRLYLIDFDLYCEGDPGLDIGNFLGHLTEHSLRTLGEPGGLVELERAMEERFVELAGEASRAAVWSYATLTLVRHVYLSTLFPERRPLTGPLLDLCEERLDVTRRVCP